MKVTTKILPLSRPPSQIQIVISNGPWTPPPHPHSPPQRAERAPGLALTSPNARAGKGPLSAAGGVPGPRPRDPPQQGGAVGRAESGAGVPALGGLVGAVAAVDD